MSAQIQNSVAGFNALDISASALRAQRTRLDVIASNLANAESTRTQNGGPYRRQMVVFEALMGAAPGTSERVGNGVRVSSVATDQRPPIALHMPGHPDADANGNVLLPDIRPAEEMTDLLTASRAYEANLAAFKIGRSMFQKALELGRG